MSEEIARPFSSGAALRFGWAQTKANVKPWLRIGALGALLALFARAMASPSQMSPRNGLLELAIQVGQTMLAMVYVRWALKVNDGHRLDDARIKEALSGFFPYLLTTVLYGLIVAGGFLLLVVPGFVWSLKYGFAVFLAVDKELDPVVALRESARITHGIKGQLLEFVGLAFCVNLLGALAFGVGLLVTIPTTFIAAGYVYRRLLAHAAVSSPPEVASTTLGQPVHAAAH